MDAKQQFEKRLEFDLRAENAASGAFGKLYTQAKEQFVQSKMTAAMESGQSVNKEMRGQFEKQFDTTEWVKGTAKIKKDTMAAYEGKAEGIDTNDLFSGLTNGAMSSLATGENPLTGAWYSVKHAAFGLITKIPGVGDFIGQVTAYLGSKLDYALGNRKDSFTWDQAGKRVELEGVKKRMGGLAAIGGDVDKLAVMVQESSRDFTDEEKAKFLSDPSPRSSARGTAPAKPPAAEPKTPPAPSAGEGSAPDVPAPPAALVGDDAPATDDKLKPAAKPPLDFPLGDFDTSSIMGMENMPDGTTVAPKQTAADAQVDSGKPR